MTVSKTIPTNLIDSLLSGYKKTRRPDRRKRPTEAITKALVERALEAEMTEHLGHARHNPVMNPTGNTRNGKSQKTLKGDFGELPIEIPRAGRGMLPRPKRFATVKFSRLARTLQKR